MAESGTRRQWRASQHRKEPAVKCDFCWQRVRYTLRHPMNHTDEHVCDDHSRARIGNGWAIITRWL